MNAGRLYFGTDPRELGSGASSEPRISVARADTQRQTRGRNSLTLFDV